MPALSALFWWGRIIQHPAELSFLCFGEGRCARALGLQQGTEENSIVLFSAGAAQCTLVDFIPHALTLEHIGFPLAAPVA
ncbi:MAG TPA: hypothetical protein VD930_11355 [Gemmatimonadales bacterium]|nr:hypothetical protein [Gemmatimonadales bacterium]